MIVPIRKITKCKSIGKGFEIEKIIISILVLLNNIYINLRSREPVQKGWLIFSWFQFAFFAFTGPIEEYAV